MANNKSTKRLVPSDVDELLYMINEKHALIDCNTLDERRDVILKLMELGFTINDPSLEYLKENYTRFNFPNPGPDGALIACYMSISPSKSFISYEDFAAVFAGDELTVPMGTEFQTALSALLGI